MEYVTSYPRAVIEDGRRRELDVDPEKGIEQLYVVSPEPHGRIRAALGRAGFTRVRFEHKQPAQLGSGLTLKLGKPWEMHVRLSGDGGRVLLHAEVEVSRDYMQHLFSQRTPVVYEVVRMLEEAGIRCGLRSSAGDIDRADGDCRIRLADPALPAFAWKPMVFSIGAVGILYLVKYLLTV